MKTVRTDITVHVPTLTLNRSGIQHTEHSADFSFGHFGGDKSCFCPNIIFYPTSTPERLDFVPQTSLQTELTYHTLFPGLVDP